MKTKITTPIPNGLVNSQNGKTHMQWIITVAVNLTVMSYGLQIGWPASVASVLQSDESPTGSPLSTLDVSWLVSSPSLAAALSIPVWTFLVDKYGRKPSVVICAVLPVISWLCIIFATNMTFLMSGRIAAGVAAGGCFFVIPMYVKEISRDDFRGALGLVINTSRNLGILAMYLMGYLSYYTTLWIALAVAIVGVLAVLKAPESPTYYVKIGKNDVAASSIAFFRNLKVDDTAVQKAVEALKAEDDKFKLIPNLPFFGIFKQKAWCKGFVFMILLMVCHGLNGGFAIVNYAPIILDMFEVTVNQELLSLSIPIVMIIGSLLSMLFIERIGRKIRAKVMGCLVMIGCAGAFVQNLLFGLMSDAFGIHVTFMFYGVVNLCGALVALVLLPETKMKSIEQIELELEKKLEL